LTDKGVRHEHAQGGGQGRSQEGKEQRCPFLEATSYQQQVRDDALGKFVQNHTSGCQQAGKDTHRKRDGVNKPGL